MNYQSGNGRIVSESENLWPPVSMQFGGAAQQRRHYEGQGHTTAIVLLLIALVGCKKKPRA
jgi:hypothetical protein